MAVRLINIPLVAVDLGRENACYLGYTHVLVVAGQEFGRWFVESEVSTSTKATG